MAQMRKTPRGQSPLGPGKFIGTNEAETAKEIKRMREGKPTYVTKGKPSTVQQVAKRFNVTAREARDIATAIGSIAASSNTGRLKKTSANLVKQVKEVGTAVTTGKKGTSSDLTQKNMSASKPYTYRKGTKRK
jgi:hypothetical protein